MSALSYIRLYIYAYNCIYAYSFICLHCLYAMPAMICDTILNITIMLYFALYVMPCLHAMPDCMAVGCAAARLHS